MLLPLAADRVEGIAHRDGKILAMLPVYRDLAARDVQHNMHIEGTAVTTRCATRLEV
jgi:hypothetical protein